MEESATGRVTPTQTSLAAPQHVMCEDDEPPTDTRHGTEPLRDADDTERYVNSGMRELVEEVSEYETDEEDWGPEDSEDLLTHGHVSDLKWCMKDYQPPRYRYLRYRVPSEIREEVLRSNRVRNVISLLHKDAGRSESDLTAEASSILEEMGHEFSLTILRVLGGFIRKIFRQILTKITVHKEGMEALKRLSSTTPLLLIPTHRSYLDFMLVSWILYSFGIKTPVIAAGQDFMHMKGVGCLLRRCGAYFIRRSFGKDKLYWALFTEYTQTHVINGDAPIEFFIEGTRSRTGKSLQPKFGMLTIALEPYFDARVADIAICPISLSYEKTVEENLHVRELMGIPKPKESTTGLIKARAILENNYGSIHVKIGEILTVHSMAQGKVDRKLRAIVPRAVIPSVHPHERSFVNELAYKILLEQQRNAVVFPCSVLAALLLFHVQLDKLWVVRKDQLFTELKWAGGTLLKLGCKIAWEDVCIEHCVKMLAPVVYCDADNIIVDKNPPSSEHLTNVFKHCHTLISLGRRRNEFMHSVIHITMLSKVLCRPTSLQRTLSQYLTLRAILQCEFVFMPGAAEIDFEHFTLLLQKHSIISYNAEDDVYKWCDADIRKFFVSLIDPFLVTYNNSWQFCISYMPRTQEHSETIKSLAKRVQTYLSILYREPYVHGESLNLSVITNSILVLEKLDLVNIEKSAVFCGDPHRFSDTIRDLALIVYPLSAKL